MIKHPKIVSHSDIKYLLFLAFEFPLFQIYLKKRNLKYIYAVILFYDLLPVPFIPSKLWGRKRRKEKDRRRK